MDLIAYKRLKGLRPWFGVHWFSSRAFHIWGTFTHTFIPKPSLNNRCKEIWWIFTCKHWSFGNYSDSIRNSKHYSKQLLDTNPSDAKETKPQPVNPTLATCPTLTTCPTLSCTSQSRMERSHCRPGGSQCLHIDMRNRCDMFTNFLVFWVCSLWNNVLLVPWKENLCFFRCGTWWNSQQINNYSTHFLPSLQTHIYHHLPNGAHRPLVQALQTDTWSEALLIRPCKLVMSSLGPMGAKTILLTLSSTHCGLAIQLALHLCNHRIRRQLFPHHSHWKMNLQTRTPPRAMQHCFSNVIASFQCPACNHCNEDSG